MNFQMFPPHPSLSGIFRAYIVQQGYCAQEVSAVLSAKGVGAIMFPFQEPADTRMLHGGIVRGEIHDQAILLGLSSVPHLATYQGPVNLLICVLQATGIHHFLRADSSEITNCVHALDCLHLPPLFREAQDRLWGIADGAQAMQLLETYFLHYFSALVPPNWQHDLRPVSSYVERRGGLVSVAEMAQKFRVTPRALEKSFLRQVGVGPKKYCQLVRFRGVMQHLAAHPATTWPGVVARFNYTDQSHLIRDFHHFSGHTPVGLLTHAGLSIDQHLFEY